MGPRQARAALDHVSRHSFDFHALSSFRPPAAAAADWPGLCTLLLRLHQHVRPCHAQVRLVRVWYRPHLERLYEAAEMRAGDLEQLEQIAAAYPSRERFLTELALDPAGATGNEAGDPHLDDDYLILSTIHSAKGQEWDVVYVLNVVDGCIPSDMASGSAAQIEEERRLLYVAMTRAREQLHLVQPQRFFASEQHRFGDRHLYGPNRSGIISSAARTAVCVLGTRRAAPRRPPPLTSAPAYAPCGSNEVGPRALGSRGG
jgi:DNA helicase-2/ATP-dependent DNA helicase PcrA